MEKDKLILCHVNEAEQQAFIALQGKKEYRYGVLDFSGLAKLVQDRTFKPALLKIVKGLKKTNPSQKKEIGKEVFSRIPFRGGEEKTEISKKVAAEGRGKDKSLVFLPVSFVKVLLEANAAAGLKPCPVNKKTGLIEFVPVHTPFGLLGVKGAAAPLASGGGWATWGPIGLGVGLLATTLFSGLSAGREAKKAAKIHEQMEADNRDWQERMMRRLGYFDEFKPDNRPVRLRPNPAYNSKTMHLVPAYLGKEYYDPRTGKAVTGDEAMKLKAERDALRPDKANELGYQYEPVNAEEQKAQDTPAMIASMTGQQTLNDMEAFKRKQQRATYREKPKERHRFFKESDSDSKSMQEDIEDMESKHREGKFSHSHSRSSFSDRSKRFKQGGLVSHLKSFDKSGGIHGKGDGQSDDIKTSIPSGSYIIDATTVAHLGNGSSSAGIKTLDSFTSKVKASAPHLLRSIAPQVKQSQRLTPVAIANEEYKIDPVTVATIGGGSIDHGASRLKKMVHNVRKHKASGGLALPPKAKLPEEYI